MIDMGNGLGRWNSMPTRRRSDIAPGSRSARPTAEIARPTL
jgi:hypothetical protein